MKILQLPKKQPRKKERESSGPTTVKSMRAWQRALHFVGSKMMSASLAGCTARQGTY